MNQGKHPTIRRLAAFALAVVLCLTLAGPALAADDATASSIQLAKTEGTVSATNSAGRSVSLVKNLRLFNGYHVVTSAKSYAWLNLDSAKLLKEDASSNVEVRKSGKKLEVLVSSGNLFFNVTEPLDDDETLNIRTSTTLTGVRGTCGWVEVIDRWNTNVYILEGKVECAVTDPVSGEEELTTISAGETAAFTVRSAGASATNGVKITKTSCDVDDVPGYVLVDLAGNRSLCNDIRDASGLDILGELSKGGDPAAEAQRRLEAEEAAAASRLASIAAQEQAQASSVEAASGTADTAGDWSWRYDESAKTLYIEGSGNINDFANRSDAPWYAYRQQIESVVIGKGITRIGNNTFGYCSNLMSAAIPDSVTSIGDCAFQSCYGLTNITIPASVTSIGSEVFQYCSNLTSVSIPDSVTSIGDYAFYGCTSLTSVTIPGSVTSIGGYTFTECTSLTSVTIQNGVTSIGSRAFQGCTSLTGVSIPDSVTSIGRDAFYGCYGLLEVRYGGDEAQWSAISIESGNTPLTNAAIHYAGAPSTPAAPGSTDIPGDLTMAGT